MSLSFTAHCQRGHDRVDFTDRAEFEAHMTGEHKAKRHNTGDACWHGSMRVPSLNTPRPGGLPNTYLRPKAAPKTTAGLAKVLHAATAGGKHDKGYPGWGAFAGVCDDWQTDERIAPTDLRPGDVFDFGRREYTVVEVHEDTWTVSAEQNGTTQTKRLDEKNAAKLREAGLVVVLKRAAA